MVVLAGASAGACGGGPSLALSVHQPAGYGVTQTVVTVYVGDNVSCDALEYGDFTADELAAVTTDEVDVTGGGSVEVDRLGAKSLVARGYDNQHRFITAGCKDLGALSGTTDVEIDNQPTAAVAINPGTPDEPFAGQKILLTMADINGAPLDGMVSWQLTGPAGAMDSAPSTGVMTSGGQGVIMVNDLGVTGPEALRIRAPWATAPLPLLTAFDLVSATGGMPLMLAGNAPASLHPSCDLRGHAGKLPTLVCLTPQATALNPHRDAVEIAWQNGQYVTTPIALPASVVNQFAIVVDHDGSADEPVYVISAGPMGANGNWYQVGATGTGNSVTFSNSLQSVVYVGRCPGSATAFVGVTTGPDLLSGVVLSETEAFFTPAGTKVTMDQPGEAFSGGCVTDADGKLHQGVVVTGMGGDAALFLIDTKGVQTAVPSPKLTGSGFITVTTGGATEQRFAGTRTQATGTVVFEAVLATDAKGGYSMVERTEVDAAAPPTKIVGGLLDKDGDTDLMWDMATGAKRRAFQVSLAKQLDGEAMTAITAGTTSADASATAMNEDDFVVGDLDGDGIDEIVVFTPNAIFIY